MYHFYITENVRKIFSNIFMRYRNGTLAWNVSCELFFQAALQYLCSKVNFLTYCNIVRKPLNQVLLLLKIIFIDLKNQAKIINGKTRKMIILVSAAHKNITNTINAPLLSA